MAENEELQARIAALTGRIDQHKRQTHNNPYHITNPYHTGRGRGDHSWSSKPGTPYGIPRGRGGRVAQSTHRNRTLVLNNVSPAMGTSSGTSGPSSIQESEAATRRGWVSKVDRHMQLINTSVYDQVSQQRVNAMAETAEQKRKDRDALETRKLHAYFNTPQSRPTLVEQTVPLASDHKHQIQIDGLKFQVLDGGSKLVRIHIETDRHLPTPKQSIVGGVTFLRSKNGNLYRAGLVKATIKKRPLAKSTQLCPSFTSTGSPFLPYVDRLWRHPSLGRGLSPSIMVLTHLTGQCSKGPSCRYTHDANKVAICKDFLAKGTCPLGDACDLSHEANAHRVPACVHFLRGNCNNEQCRYAHVRVAPGAPVCRDFAKIGYCEKGITCAERHVHECPDYANKGLCRNKKCRLPHVDRAGQLRKAAAAAAAGADAMPLETSPDLSSDEEQYDSEDFDSDHVEDFFGLPGDTSGDMSQQRDYIKF